MMMEVNMALSLNVNGDRRGFTADPVTPLVDVLREEFHLTGAKPVCREGFCGACMVLVDDRPTLSCLMPAALAQDCEVRTVEGLAANGTLNPIQQALEACDAVQCGMCFPGMVVTLTHLLKTTPGATRDDVRTALTGNICRCTGYEGIVEAAVRALAAT
jgi:carbon-monoxide dehydrogenase small subunit